MPRVPSELAPEARELLSAFIHWCAQPKQEGVLKDEDWTWDQVIDLFILECGANEPMD